MLICQAVPSPIRTKAAAWTLDAERRSRAIQLLARITAAHERALTGDVARVLRSVARRAATAASHGAFAEAEAAADAEDGSLQRALIARGLVVARAMAAATLGILGEAEAKDATGGLVGIANDAVAQRLRKRTAERVVEISDHTRGLIRTAIADGVEAGEGQLEIAQRIMGKVGNLGPAGGLEGFVRAERIARTENHFAANLGSHEAARATGLDLDKEWGSVEDSRTRASHAAADGQTVDFSAPFVVGGSELDYPGDPDGPAKEVISCRCVTLYVPRIPGNRRRPAGAPTGPDPAPAPPPAPPPPTIPAPASTPPAATSIRRKPTRAPKEVALPQGATWSADDERRISGKMRAKDRDARRLVIERGIATNTEHLVAVDRTYNVEISRVTSGQRSQVVFPEDLMIALNSPRRQIAVHHNHPSSSSFSTADLYQVAVRRGLSELWAHGHDGTAYRARPVDRDGNRVAAAHVAAKAAAAQILTESRNDLTYPEAMALISHASALALGRAGLVDYAVFAPQLKRDLYSREKALLNFMTSAASRAMSEGKGGKADDARRRHLIDLPWSISPDEEWLLARDELAAVPGDDPDIVEARQEIAAELRRRGLA